MRQRFVSREKLAAQLRKFRAERQLTQRDAAEALCIDRSTYAYYETAKTVPDINQALELCELFRITLPVLCAVRQTPGCPDGTGRTMYIFGLQKQERQIIAAFRLLFSEQQEALLRWFAGEQLLLHQETEEWTEI